MKDLIENIGAFFDHNSFANDFFFVIFGAVFGGICTVIINNGAMRKQCKFDMQYKILSEETEKVADICKKIDEIEIGLSFGTGETAPLKSKINEVKNLLFSLNESFENKRKFVRKYLSAVIVEKSTQYISEYKNIFYTHGNQGFFDLLMISKIDSDKITALRELSQSFKILDNEMTEAMETLIEPSIISKVKRKMRTIVMYIEKCTAIWKVHKSEKKR